MKIVVSPDSYKGSLSSIEVSKSMKKGIQKAISNAEIKLMPLADGGEGTLDTLVTSTNGEFISEEVQGPLGDAVIARWGLLDSGRTAIIEMAEASGLTLIPKEKLNPLEASTYGTGQLIKSALNKGCKKIILGIGGSATNDGGSGMVAALGVKLLDSQGQELKPGGGSLSQLDRISIDQLDQRIYQTEFIVASDVSNPLCGPEGASYIFGPQKGATPEMVTTLDQGLKQYAEKIKQYLSKDILNEPGAGAAGGLGAGLITFLNASIKPGIEIILDLLEFEKDVINADLVITGEGKTDIQTSFGKAPMGVGIRAQKHGVPVICVSGSVDPGIEALERHGINAAFSILNQPQTLEEAMANTDQLIQITLENLMKVYKLSFEAKRVIT
ncbi:glycerate kinase [Halalkalibacter wakoensis JCM 9140]|uniref:Glycerate kinase n=1 Tax=Halalkalibacter wakoensis JCM 9140 TaxID=1236970 RepID=W4Q7P5_9BACI|nr:glycerate kinase [Halalkalibacter wakoensis]GAE27728.1 glycerate kinase [Halalkalibacter wakoensis JCM 9140]